MNTKNTREILEIVQQIFSTKIPFNNLLGLKLETLDIDNAKITFEMRDELVGNFIHGILHGGVISATLDVMGGFTAFLGILRKMEDRSYEEKIERFSRLGTIDLRIDYLRPGKGKLFIATGSVLRTGNKVAVTRMELHNDENKLIALGTGTYLVG